MEILTYPETAQIDPAVDLGVIPPPLPEILTLRQLAEVATPPPPQIIEGILHQGCKLVLGGTSKSNKSWCLLDLAISVASGQPWWGRSCTKLPVLYINFELPEWSIAHRINCLCGARPDCKGVGDQFHVWNLRGYNADMSLLRPKLEDRIAAQRFGLIILDPAYKLLGTRDENANGDIASLMNEFEALARSSGAAIALAHHFAKGDSTVKNAIDRMSGAGAWARDPDSIVILTPHEQPDCFTVTTILRNLPMLPEFVLEWRFPVMTLATDLDPNSLRRPQSKNKVCSDREFVQAVLSEGGQTFSSIVRQAKEHLDMSEATTRRYLNRLKDAQIIRHSSGLYWANPLTP